MPSICMRLGQKCSTDNKNHMSSVILSTISILSYNSCVTDSTYHNYYDDSCASAWISTMATGSMDQSFPLRISLSSKNSDFHNLVFM